MKPFNQFHTTGLFPYFLKTLENQRFAKAVLIPPSIETFLIIIRKLVLYHQPSKIFRNFGPVINKGKSHYIMAIPSNKKKTDKLNIAI